ncbi:MAG: RNA polymerase sigma-70 factor [Tangfeifania sp.]
MKDTELLYRIRTGDKKAFDGLFLLYYQKLCRFAFTFIHDTDECEEVVQRMFVRLWEKRKNLKIPENPKAFLFKSVYYESMKNLRLKNTRDKHQSKYILYSNLEQEETEDFSMVLPYLNAAIERLPKKCRLIFVLHKLEGLTQKEIADYLGISVKTVENQVANAILKLREELKPYLHLLPAALFFSMFC